MIKRKNVVSTEQIEDLLSPFGVYPTPDQVSMIREYIAILLKWNNSIGLTTILEPSDIVTRHFGESMFAASLLPVENGRLADVGSGAGFPGLALKILRQNLLAILIESNKKKCAFLWEIARSLGLAGVDVIPSRFEDIRAGAGFADFVTVRAVGNIPDVLRWSQTTLATRGHVILWIGGEESNKVSHAPGWIWHPAVRIPESQRRFVLIGRPVPSGRA